MFRSPEPRPGWPTSPLPAVLVAALVLGAAACGGGGGGEGGGDRGESAASAGATTTTAAAGGDTPTSTTPTAPTTAVPAPPGEGTTLPAGGAGDEPPGAAEGCAETRTWGTEPREAGRMAAEDVYRVRAGRHACYDRVVFDVNGVVDGPDAAGFHVAYVQGDVQADGSGEPVATAGDAALEVIVRAPALGYGTSGHQPGRLLGALGDDLVTPDQVAGWPALREVTFAGSFEGQTTFAVGVDRELPFRVGAFEADGYTHVYVDIARP